MKKNTTYLLLICLLLNREGAKLSFSCRSRIFPNLTIKRLYWENLVRFSGMEQKRLSGLINTQSNVGGRI